MNLTDMADPARSGGAAGALANAAAASVRRYDAGEALLGVRNAYPAGAFAVAAGLGFPIGSAVRGCGRRGA